MNSIERVKPGPDAALLKAIEAGRISVDTTFFPCYSWEYIDSCSLGRKFLVVPYNIIYYGVSVIAKIAKYALMAIGAVVVGIYKALDWISCGSLKRIYDYVCPINPINGKHQLVFPYVFEKFLLEYLFPVDWREDDKDLTQMCEKAIHKSVEPYMTHVDDSGPFTKAISWTYNDCCCPDYHAVKKQPEDKPKEFSYTVKVLTDGEEMNAFSTLGGEIYINAGLLKKVKECVDTEEPWIKKTTIPLPGGATIALDLDALNKEVDEENTDRKPLVDKLIQMVFLHEACHSQLRHNALGLMFACVVKIVLTVVDFFLFEPTILKVFIDFYASACGRWNEHEADIAAAYFANKAGINPLTAIYFQALSLKGHRGEDAERQGDKQLKWFASHPSENERKRALYAAIETFAPDKLQAANPTISMVPDHPYPFSEDRSSDGVKWVLDLLKRPRDQLVKFPEQEEEPLLV